MIRRPVPFALTVGALLAGCVEISNGPTAVSDMPPTPEEACLAAVSRAANIGDVVLQSSRATGGGTDVIVGVDAGAAGRTLWTCTARTDGTTERIAPIGGGDGGS